MHLDDEQVQRLLHGELASSEATRVRDHVAQCHDCRGRFDSAHRDEQELGDLLRHLDHPPPRITARAVIDRARSDDRSWMKRAAVIVLMVSVAGVAAAAPGSPLRSLLGHTISAIRGVRQADAPRAPGPAAPALSGIAVAPGSRLVIQFTVARAGSTAHVTLTDGPDVVVRAPVGAAVFTSNDDRLVIQNAGASATFEIEIPRAAPHVEIRIHDTRVFTKTGARVAPNASLQTSGGYTIPLGEPRS